VDVCSPCSEKAFEVVFAVRSPGDAAIILDPDEEFPAVCIRERDECLPNVAPDRLGVAWPLCRWRPCDRALELAKMAFTQRDRCSHSLREAE